MLQAQMKSLVAFVKKSLGEGSDGQLTPTGSQHAHIKHRTGIEDITNGLTVDRRSSVKRHPRLNTSGSSSNKSLNATVVTNRSRHSDKTLPEGTCVDHPSATSQLENITISDYSTASSLDTTAKMEPDFQFEPEQRISAESDERESMFLNEFEVVLKKKNGSFGKPPWFSHSQFIPFQDCSFCAMTRATLTSRASKRCRILNRFLS